MRVQTAKEELEQVAVVVGLTGVFESIASFRISQIHSQVVQSQDFFSELWNMYTDIRVDSSFHFGRRLSNEQINNKELIIVITGEEGFSGDIDEKLVRWMAKNYQKDQHDVLVIGRHGAVQLVQNGVPIIKYFKMPAKDENINPVPIIEEVQKYKTASAYYQSYVSLMVQDVKRISLMAAVQERGATVHDTEREISEATYIFEPSPYAVIDYLERSMLANILSQIILESKLAQYASRFRAMSKAHERARDLRGVLDRQYNRSRRSNADESTREIMAAMRKIRR